MGCSTSQRPVFVHENDTGKLLVSLAIADDWVKIHLKDGSSCQGQVMAINAEAITLRYPEFGHGRRSTKQARFAWTDIERMEMRDPHSGDAWKFLIGVAAGVALSFVWLLSQLGNFLG